MCISVHVIDRITEIPQLVFQRSWNFTLQTFSLVAMAVWKTDNYGKTVESRCEKNFTKVRTTGIRIRNGNAHDGATSVVYYSNGHVKWKMNPYKRGSWEEMEPESFTSCYRRRESRLLSPSRVRPSTTAAAIRFINNYSLCTRENYSLYPSSTSTCSCAFRQLLSVFFLDSSLLYPSPCHALVAKYFVFIRYCMFAEFYGCFMHYCVPRNNNL